ANRAINRRRMRGHRFLRRLFGTQETILLKYLQKSLNVCCQGVDNLLSFYRRIFIEYNSMK
ncbi:hypothetical protein, partial [Holdemania massiliensis]|uniref:hypothetical protein n=1 Tax=Holdemania massiliensis TaxID=1468449 RepID=UPI001AD83497